MNQDPCELPAGEDTDREIARVLFHTMAPLGSIPAAHCDILPRIRQTMLPVGTSSTVCGMPGSLLTLPLGRRASPASPRMRSQSGDQRNGDRHGKF